MVINPKNTFVAYRCPDCGSGVISSVGVFSVSADMLKLKCKCGKSEMTIVSAPDGKLRLTVPCLICPKPHFFTVSRSIFFGRDLFVIPCPYSDVNICFMGEFEKVSDELSRTELELIDMLGPEDIKALAGQEANNDLLTDPQMIDILMFVIKDLAAEHKIFCKCEDSDPELCVELTNDGFIVSCKRCGASRLVQTDSLISAHAFLTCDRIILE